MKDKYILVVGDDILDSGTRELVTKTYNKFIQSYIEDPRPSKMPSIWKCIKEPKQ
jgi:hypothetical protein